MTVHGWCYDSLKNLVAGEKLPLVVVDLDILDENVRRLGSIAERHGKKIRIATKSVRVPALIRHIMEQGGETFQGLMCYSVQEAHLLSSLGFRDLLVAYPTVQKSDLDSAAQVALSGNKITLMVDTPAHLDALEAYWSGAEGMPPLNVCIEVDMSYRPLGGAVHLGVRRSPIRGMEAFGAMIQALRHRKHLRLAGVMGYEAQIAGLPDASPFAPALNPIKKLIKKLSMYKITARRSAINRLLEREGIQIDFFNGGGTGSIRTTSQDPSVTEVTAGSGFLQSQLFDYYSSNENRPAFCFALQISRIPECEMITCLGGGYIASGETSQDKSPVPFLPGGLHPVPHEGFGEVQTPLLNKSGYDLKPGDPVFFRPAKAGEIAERFSEYLLKRGDKIVDRVKTYRGLGQCFF